MMNIQSIPISDIRRDEEQPRKYFDEEALSRLTQSIKNNGLEIPITVRKNGTGYVIIDGERRWRASKEAGLKSLDCIVSEKNDILEQQLRSDCLKEGLTVDELDMAIYRYYDMCKTTLSHASLKARKDSNPYLDYISKQVGKSEPRIQKAIDRFEFKRDNNEFVKQIEKEHNPENKKYSKVNSTIAMTSQVKDAGVRKAVIETVLQDRKADKPQLNNEKIKDKINEIVERGIKDPQDARVILNSTKQDIKKDPRFIFTDMFFKFQQFKSNFEKYEFEKVKDHIQGEKLQELISDVSEFLKYIKSMEI